VHYTQSHGLTAWIDNLLPRDDRPAHVAVRTGHTCAAPVIAATGIGAAVVPLSALPARFSGAVKPLRLRQGRPLLAYTHLRNDPLLAAFVAELVAVGVSALPAANSS
jgi:hypothetical protein